jgi:hypothetical protein
MMMGRPMVVRRRPLLRAAAVGGTYAAGRAAGRRAEERANTEAGQDQPGAGSTVEQDNGGGTVPVFDQLSQLTAMHDQGALTDEEFAAAKAKVLGG